MKLTRRVLFIKNPKSIWESISPCSPTALGTVESESVWCKRKIVCCIFSSHSVCVCLCVCVAAFVRAYARARVLLWANRLVGQQGRSRCCEDGAVIIFYFCSFSSGTTLPQEEAKRSFCLWDVCLPGEACLNDYDWWLELVVKVMMPTII